ncbi:MAG: zf-HC2 domain-containing protein [Thermoanaerobaculaceae bacterium]
MSCHEVRQLFPVLQRGEIAPTHRKALREHLRSCEPCRASLFTFDPALALALALPQAGFEDDRFVAEVLSGVHQRRAEQALLARRRSKLWKVAAVFLLATLMGLWVGHQERQVSLAKLQEKRTVSPVEPFVEVEGEGVRVYHLVAGPEDRVPVAFIVSPSVEL